MTAFPPRVIELVQSLLGAGCDMWAVGSGYYVGEPIGEPSANEVHAILTDFGERQHLIEEISGYLKSIGRDIAVDCPD